MLLDPYWRTRSPRALPSGLDWSELRIQLQSNPITSLAPPTAPISPASSTAETPPTSPADPQTSTFQRTNAGKGSVIPGPTTHARREQGTKGTDATAAKAPAAPAPDDAKQEKHKRPKATIKEWHNSFGHLSNTQIRKLHAVKLIEIKSFKHEHEACEVCCQSKATKHPSRQKMLETSRPFQRLHFDIIGGKDLLPFNSELYKYIFVVIDDYTRYKWAFPLNRKSQAILKLQWLI